MSKSAKNLLRNSFLQAGGTVGVITLNFVLTIGYARILGPESLGQLITAQAHVLVWVALVDLGLSNALISALAGGENHRNEFGRQGFRARDIVSRVMWLRLLGAAIASVGIILTAIAREHLNPDQSYMSNDFAFLPFLFAIALQNTSVAYANFRRRQGLGVIAVFFGTLVAVIVPLTLAALGAPIPLLLFAQSWGGWIVGLLVLIGLRMDPQPRYGKRDRTKKPVAGPWQRNAWRALLRDAWPYALAFAAVVIWQRLDQMAASTFLGFASGGQYAVVIRVASIPIMLATAVNQAIFPDLQRVGYQFPEKVVAYIGASQKLVFRFGFLFVGMLLFLAGIVVGPLVPQFREGMLVLPWFLPGVWFFWLQAPMVNGLFGLRRYGLVLGSYAIALFAYVLFLPFLTKTFGLKGIAIASNIFPGVLFLVSREFAIQQKIIRRQSLASDFSRDERALLNPILQRWERVKSAFFQAP